MSHTVRVEQIISGPDSLGRYIHVRAWDCENPPYCLTCGACASRKCACYDNLKVRRQVYNFELPEEGKNEMENC